MGDSCEIPGLSNATGKIGCWAVGNNKENCQKFVNNDLSETTVQLVVTDDILRSAKLRYDAVYCNNFVSNTFCLSYQQLRFFINKISI